MTDRPTLEFWADDLTPEERGRLAVAAQKIIAQLPFESYRRDYDLFNVRLYENNPVITLYNYAGEFYSGDASTALPPTEQSTNNKAKAAIDTLCAQVFTTDQRARFKVVNGTGKQRRRATELQNFADGLALELKLHQLKKRAGKDACILESGVGVLVFSRQGDKVHCERSLATEWSIDPWDGVISGQPATLYRRRPVARAAVLATWAPKDKTDEETNKLRDIILHANRVTTTGAPGDYIEVFEAWHLQTNEDTEDGWHVIALDAPDGILTAERFKRSRHDAVMYSLEDRTTTAWGLSLMTQMRPLQIRINANEWRREKARKLCHSGHLYVDRAAKMNKSALTNEIGTVWEGNGPNPPQPVTFANVTAEWTQAIERDGQLIFENHGISVAASQGETNAGLNASAASKREDTQKSDRRNADKQQRWEQFHLDCMEAALDIVREIVTTNADGTERGKTAKGSSTYRVRVPGEHGGLTVSDWKEAALDKEDYVMQIRPASPIPTEPAGLVAFGERMLEIGEWTPGTLTGYLQDLDADGRVNRDRAVERNLEKTFEKLLYDKVAAATPDEFTNYKLALKIGLDYLAQGEEDQVPEKHLERVRRYLKRCMREAKKLAAAAAPPPAAAMPGAPMAGGAPPAGPPALAAV